MEIQENCKFDIKQVFDQEETSQARVKCEKCILKKAAKQMRKIAYQALSGHLAEC